MKDKIIELIKKYRAESERLWNPTTGYPNNYYRVWSIAYEKCANDLEKLLYDEDK